MKTVAGIDLGTQSMKVVLYDYETRKSLESSSCPMELISESDGTREQKTEWYKKGLEVCFSKISSEGKKSIQAIGVSGQQHGFVPLDSEGNPLYNIKLWNDTSTAKECELITNAAGGQNEVVKEVSKIPENIIIDINARIVNLYEHTVMVTLVSVFVARLLHLDQVRQYNIAVGALLHDLGLR